jgi:hypothetical protein
VVLKRCSGKKYKNTEFQWEKAVESIHLEDRERYTMDSLKMHVGEIGSDDGK